MSSWSQRREWYEAHVEKAEEHHWDLLCDGPSDITLAIFSMFHDFAAFVTACEDVGDNVDDREMFSQNQLLHVLAAKVMGEICLTRPKPRSMWKMRNGVKRRPGWFVRL